MAKTYGTLEVRRMRGNLVLIGLGRTERGQRYIKGQAPIASKDISSTNFKAQLAVAMAKLSGETG
ncbi:MAG: hypothetical protein KAJ55_08780 [Anaerolineales bacterium]|nr:hypothetical protein [Anaerolineales bacterium]